MEVKPLREQAASCNSFFVCFVFNRKKPQEGPESNLQLINLQVYKEEGEILYERGRAEIHTYIIYENKTISLTVAAAVTIVSVMVTYYSSPRGKRSLSGI